MNNTMDQIKLICNILDQRISDDPITKIFFYVSILAVLLFWAFGALLAKSHFKTKYSLFTMLFLFCWTFSSGIIIAKVSYDYYAEFTMGALVMCSVLSLFIFFIQAIIISFAKKNYTEKNKPIDQV